jgi:uncharacterized protein YkwD/uncharacterized membrane protein required for colicin V production
VIDLVIVALLGLLLVRGWLRGFVREGMDLVGLVFGTVLAFRLGPAVGVIVTAMANTSDEASRLIGGFIVFFGVGIGAAFVTRAIERRARMPGLNLVNRAGGAGLAAAWGVFLATLMLTLAVVLPMPPAVADSLDDSAVARTLTDPSGLPQELFTGLSGDRIIETMLNLRDVVGTRRVIVESDAVVEIPPADSSDLEQSDDAAREIFDLVNRARIEAGLDPLAWSDALATVGLGHAFEMYEEGYFAHRSPETGDVGDRLQAAGITYAIGGENLALAATVEDVHDGLMDSPGHRANIEGESYRRLGVAVVSGPLGLMTVQVFTG